MSFSLLLFLSLLSCSLEACSNDGMNTITISDTGSDTDCTATHDCASLEYVLTSSLVKDCTKIILYDNQTLSTSLTINGITNFTVEGGTAELAQISVRDGGSLKFEKCINVNLEWLNFISDEEIDSSPLVLPALHFDQCANISLIESEYKLSTNILMTDDSGTINISRVNFFHHESNLTSSLLKVMLRENSVSGSVYAVIDSSFNGVSNSLSNFFRFDEQVNNLTNTGGGLSIEVKEGVTNIKVLISNSEFLSNTAVIGGGLFIKMRSSSKGAEIILSNVSFIENRAMDLGGGLYIAVTDNSYLPEVLVFNIRILSCSFIHNEAEHGGGIAYQTIGNKNINASLGFTLIKGTVFKQNSALFSGAAAGFFRWEAALGGDAPLVNISDCTFTDNAMMKPGQDIESTVVGSGILYTQKTPIALSGHTLMRNNFGTVILASSVLFQMFDQVDIMSNVGARGGAINLIGGARIIVGKGLNLTFKDNYAELFGGVVYHVFPVFGVIDQNQYCTFQYEDNAILDPSQWNANISFINNTALESGNSVYISSPDSCYQNDKGFIFREKDTFHFYPNYTDQITTPPVSITFSSFSTSHECNGHPCFINLMLGEQFTLIPHSVDGFGQTVKSFALIDLFCVDGDILYRNKSCQYELGGTNLVELNNAAVRVPFFIKGAQNNGSVVLAWQTIQQPSAVAYLYVNITDCYLGYVYDSVSGVCACYNKSEVVFCNSTSYIACVNIGYWYGKIDESGSDTQFAATSCSFGSCNYTVSGTCPTKSCGPDGSPQQFYCELPRHDPEKLCLFNRGGPICSLCKENYSFTFDAIGCVPDEKCSNAYIALYIFLSLLFWVLLISAILIFTKLDLRFGSGQLHCFIFFFSVMQYFVHGSFPSYGLYAVELILTGFIQLDPKMFGLINVCAPHSPGPIQYAALHYVNPLFLMGAIALLIYISSKWPKYAIFIGDSSAVNMICIALYLIFFSLTQTSLSILQPVQFSGVSTMYVSLDPTLEYFDAKGHLPYALLAIVIQLFLVLPFLFLLIFAPYLIWIKKLNLTRIKPLLDEYQACYKQKYRSFAGFYLTFRQVIFFFNLFNLGISGHIYVLQIVSVLFLTIHCLVQPYAKKRLNILDGLLMLDLVLLSILHGNTANIVFDDIQVLKTIIVYILVLLPLAYIAFLCVIHFFCILKSKLKAIKARMSGRQREEDTRERITTITGSAPTKSSVSVAYDINDADDTIFVNRLEREPLLFALNDDENTSYDNNNYNALHKEPAVSVVELPTTAEDV